MSSRARDIANFGDGIDTADIGDGQITTAKIADGDVTSAKMFSGFANGITMAEEWRLTSNQTVATANTSFVFNSNLEASAESSAGTIGSGMTESSGVFTFPDTGIYLITAQSIFNRTASGSNVYSEIEIQTSTDGGSNWSGFSRGISGMTDTQINSAFTSAIVDVANTSNVKVRFNYASQSTTVEFQGDANLTRTGFSFIRLGDT